MEQFLETIRIEGGVAFHLPYHVRRMNETLSRKLGLAEGLDLVAALGDVSAFRQRTRCRVVYDRTVRSVEFFPYRIRPVKSLLVVGDDHVDYGFKYADRSALDACFARRGECDDVLIVRDGYVTDTSIANVAFLKDGAWYTPSVPLLKGTMRASLLDEGRICEARIAVDDLRQYSRLRLFNAMIPFGEIDLPMRSVWGV